MITTLMNLLRRIGTGCAFAALAGIPSLAAAVNDLPGGPADNQLNLQPPASQIAEQQQWLH